MAVQNPTANYGFVLPIPGASVGAWAAQLRAVIGDDVTGIDAIAKNLEDQFASLNASNLTSGRVQDERLTGSYTNIDDLTLFGSLRKDGTDAKFGNTVQLRTGQVSLSSSHNVGIGSQMYFRFIGTAPGNEITGLQDGVDGRFVIIQNATGAADLTFRDDDTRSSAANRLRMASNADVAVGSFDTIRFIYDGTINRWVWIPIQV